MPNELAKITIYMDEEEAREFRRLCHLESADRDETVSMSAVARDLIRRWVAERGGK